MKKRVIQYCMVALTLLITATFTLAEGGDTCTGLKDTVRDATKALEAYHDENGKYPDQLSGTSFSPPEHIVVIYEKMTINPAKEVYMVRAYRENCGAVYLATPATPEIYEVPISIDRPKKESAKTVPEQTHTETVSSNPIPFLGSLATFFTVFILVILVFYIRHKKSISVTKPGKDAQSHSNGSE